MDDFACPARAPCAGTHPPLRTPGERDIKLLGLVMMIGVFDLRPEDQKAAGDGLIREMAARAEELEPSVVIDEFPAEVGNRVGLAPAEFVRMVAQKLRKRLCLISGRRGGAVEMDCRMAAALSALAPLLEPTSYLSASSTAASGST